MCEVPVFPFAGGNVDSSSKTLLGVAKPLDEQRLEEWHYLVAVSI